MRKRIIAGSGREKTSSFQVKRVSGISNARKCKFSSGKTTNDIRKRKPSNDSSHKTISEASDEKISSISKQPCDTGGTSRVLRKDSNLLLSDERKKDPLPDILSDWEIIINSLKKTKNSTDSNNSIKICTDSSNEKNLSTDSTKEVKSSSALNKEFNTCNDSNKESNHHSPVKGHPKTLRKSEKLEAERKISAAKKLEGSILVKEDLFTPGNKAKLAKQTSSEKKDSQQLESNVWRRPTRSTYKAFEDVLETEITLDSSDLKETLDMDYENLTEKYSVKKEEMKRGSSEIKTEKNKKLRKDFTSSHTKEKGKRKLLKSEKFRNINSTPILKRRKLFSKKLLPQECTVKLIKLNDSINGDAEDELDFLGFSPDLPEDIHNSVKNMNTLMCAIKENTIDATSPPIKDLTSPPKQLQSLAQELAPLQNINIPKRSPSIDQSTEEEYESSIEEDLFVKYFGAEDLPVMHDFEGFEIDSCYQFSCRKCSLTFPDSASLFQHRIVGHRTGYLCPFDVGQCGLFKGSVQLDSHLFEMHQTLFDTIVNHLKKDVFHGLIAGYNSDKETCSICLIPLRQPHLNLHEMFVHAIWPSSIICLNIIKISDIFCVFWTGKMMAFSCKFCKKVSQDGLSAQYFLCPPSTFPTAVILHAKDLHKLDISYMQAWWLFYQLFLCLPVETRRTVSSLISLGENLHGHCLICKMEFIFGRKINLNISSALCMRCEENCFSKSLCWFGCSQSFPESKLIMDHLLEQHELELPGGWCIKCGIYQQNLFHHVINCRKYSKKCKFCSININDFNEANITNHSLKYHSFVCPVADCKLILPGNVSLKSHSTFPSGIQLYKHLTGKHMPDFSCVGLLHMPNLLETVLGKRANSLGSGFTVNLNSLGGFWYGGDKLQYRFINGHLEYAETVAIPLICSLCKAKWDCTVTRSGTSLTNAVYSLCPHCRLALKQFSIGDFMLLCPAYNCFQSIGSSTQLNEHLKRVHSFPFKCQGSFKCLKCLNLFPSDIALNLHYKIKHEIPCLFCQFLAVSEREVTLHRSVVHKILNWCSVYDYFKIHNKNNNCHQIKTPLPVRVVRVWSESDAIKVQYDRTINTLGANLPLDEKVKLSLSIKKRTESEFPKYSTDNSETYNWSSSLCKVSMSPSKASVDKELNEEAANILKRISTNDEDSNSEVEVLQNFLLPTVVVTEDTSPKENAILPTIGKVLPPIKAVQKIATILNNVNHSNREKLLVNTNGLESNSSSSASSPVFMGFDSIETPSKSPVTSIVESSSKPNLKKISDNTSINILTNTAGRTKWRGNVSKSHLKRGEQKGLGENAFINKDDMAINILKDLEDKFQSTCVDCGHIICLLDLPLHVSQFHTNKLFQCQCGYFGELSEYLVHAFHMSHQPSEARPIIMCEKMFVGVQTIIVLEMRPNAKENSFPCYKCNKRFKQEKSRQLHYNLCKLEKRHQCNQCLEKFAMESHLLKHKEWKHNPQVCQHCGKEFNSSSSLTQHVLHIHRKQLNFKCKLCNDSFHTCAQLKVHTRLHSGEQPHCCTRCQNRFISRNLLKKHMNYDHSSSSEDNDHTPYKNRKKLFSRSQFNNSNKKRKAGIAKLNALTQSDLETDMSGSETEPIKLYHTNQQRDIMKVRPFIISKSSTPNPERITPNYSNEYSERPVTLPKLREDVKAKLVSKGKKCDNCDEEFYSIAGKLLHKYLIHPKSVINEIKLNRCGFCNYKFSSANDVTDHHIDKHQRVFLRNGSFRCLCGLVFREEGAYYFHLYYAHHADEAVHVGDNIICRLCEGKPILNKIVDLAVHFSDRHTMFDHVRYKDSYMCNFCLKAFESWSVLSLHFSMVHKATKGESLSYDCPFCEGASPWHSLEALQFHLDNVHSGRHTKSFPVPQHPDYINAPVPGSPTKRNDPPIPSLKFKRHKITKGRPSNVGNDDCLYCICQCPYDEVSDMIGCDNIDCKYQWFHFECIGIMCAPEGNWFCPDCRLNQETQRDISKQSYRRPQYKVANRSNLDGCPEVHNSSISTSSSSSSSSSSNSSSGSSSSDSSSESD